MGRTTAGGGVDVLLTLVTSKYPKGRP
jgi:hypothetical protein